MWCKMVLAKLWKGTGYQQPSDWPRGDVRTNELVNDNFHDAIDAWKRYFHNRIYMIGFLYFSKIDSNINGFFYKNLDRNKM